MPLALLVTLLTVGVVLAVYAGVIEPRWLRVRRRVVHLANWPAELEGITLLHISDLHFGRREQVAERLLQRMRGIPADVVVVTGDFIAEPVAIERVCAAFRPLAAERRIMGILGNHEHSHYKWNLPGKGQWATRASIDAVGVTARLEEAGVRMLVNSVTALDIGGRRLHLVGVDDLYHGLTRLDATLEQAPASQPIVLLCHSPEILKAAARRGVALVLSGHTHGGQVRVPGIGTPFTGTKQPIPKAYGMVREGPTWMHISPGLGVTAVPFRFGVRPEMTVLELRRG